MTFDELQQEWRKEMESSTFTDSSSFKKLAMEANEINREHRFAAMLYSCMAIAIFLLGGFILITDTPHITFSRCLQVIGIPLVFAYCAVLYFKAVKNENDTDWTLAAKLKNEKAKLKRQVNLCRKLPTHMLLPLFFIVMAGVLPNTLYKFQSGVPVGKLILFWLSVAVIFGIAVYGLKREEKKRLSPLLDQLEELEKQLQED